MKKFLTSILFGLVLAICGSAAPANAQPCQWNYSLIPDPAGIATATYCGNVVINGSIVGPTQNVVTTIAALQGITNPATTRFVTVTGSQGGGYIFQWIVGSLPCNATTGGGDGGTTFCSGTPGNYLTTGYWQRQYSGAVQVPWFETAVGTDDTTAFVAALATAKDVYAPSATYIVTSVITITHSYQRLFGTADGTSKISCVFAVSGTCVSIQPVSNTPTEHVQIDHLWIAGTTNIAKVLEVGGPQTSILDSRLYGFSTNSTVIYIDDEAGGSGRYVFGSVIFGNDINGANSGDAIRIGNNANTTWITNNTNIINAGILIHINGQTLNTVIENNNLANADSTKQAILIDSVATPSVFGLTISNNYFELVNEVITVGNATLQNATINTNRAVRNPASTKSTSSFLHFSGPASAMSRSIVVTNNNVDEFHTIFSIDDDAGGSALIDTRGNTTINNTDNWTVGTYGNYALTSRIVNAALANPLFASGNFATKAIDFSNFSAADLFVSLPWASGEVADKLRFGFTHHGSGASVIAKVYSLGIDQGAGSAVQLCTTGSVTTDSDVICDLSGIKAVPNTQYYAELVFSGGTSGDLFPLSLQLRQ